jgi:azurin
MKQWFTKRVRPTSGCEFVTSRHFPDEAQGNFLLNNTIGIQGVLQHTVRAVGSGYEGKEVEPLLLSDDRNFRPVDMEFGPDGALYLTDWQEALIGHMQYSIRDPLRDSAHARIWRITYPSRPLVTISPIAGEPIEKLLDLLKLPEDRTRIRAKQELVTRPAASVLAALAKWKAPLKPDALADQHLLTEALWVQQWFHAVEPAFLAQQLRSPEPLARAAATRVLCYARDQIPNALDLLLVQAKDSSPLVRLEAVRAASFFTGLKALAVALEILNHETDYYLTYTLEETMRALQPSPNDVKDPRALAFVLNRMTNAELAAAPALEPVWIAQIERKGIDATVRENALTSLAKARNSSRAAELAAALVRLDDRNKDTGAAEELGRLLANSPRADLEKVRDVIQRMASKDHSLAPVRRAGLAARIALAAAPDATWGMTEGSTDSRTLLLDSIALLGDPALRAKFQPLVSSLLSVTEPPLPSNVRAAALRALPLLGEENVATNIRVLAAALRRGTERPIVTRALLSLPAAALPAEDVAPTAESILTFAQRVPASRRTAQDFIESVQLGNALAALLPAPEATRIRKALRELGVSVFTVKAVREQMRYDVTQLVAEAGKPFELIFENPDIMPHNLVIVTPGAREEIGNAAMTLGTTPDSAGRLYVPKSEKVLAATKMLEPGQRERLRVTAPKTPGTYEFVCTFPGHWVIMWGKLIVTTDVDAYLATHPAPTAPAAAMPASHDHHAPAKK